MTSDEQGLTCQELVELVSEYLDGTLTPDDRMRFETHIHDCGHCSNYLEQMRATVRITGRLTGIDLEPYAINELLSIFKDWKQHED